MEQPHASFLHALDAVGVAAMLLDRSGKVVAVGHLARRLVQGSEDPGYQGAAPFAAPFAGRTTQRVLADGFGKVELEGFGAGSQLAFQALDVAFGAVGYRLMILIDLVAGPPPCSGALEKVFALTAAEARLAVELGGGAALSSIACSRGLSVATLRTQLASIFAKTGTTRQPELVALVARVCRFAPEDASAAAVGSVLPLPLRRLSAGRRPARGGGEAARPARLE